MYECFYEECLQSQMDDIPKEWLYRNIFTSEFNLSFKEHGNDTCDFCDEYTIKLKGASTTEERNELQIHYDDHLLDADNRYWLKRQDKGNAPKTLKC